MGITLEEIVKRLDAFEKEKKDKANESVLY